MQKSFSLRFFLILSLALSACKQSIPEPQVFPHAAVVTAHPLATEVGVKILQDGGNAIDAAVGVHFALAVVLPAAGNIGGGGFLLTRSKNGEVHSLDFREKAPAAAHRSMYLDSLGDPIPELSWLGHLAAGVPGTVAGMRAAHDSLGLLPWYQLLQPAINLAAQGFVLTAKEAQGLEDRRSIFLTHNTRPAPYWGKSNWQAGDSLRLPDLARTLTAIRDEGVAGFYEGWVADSIVAEMHRGNGIMNHEDLANYRPVWRHALQGHYRDCSVISMGPPSSGGLALLQLLAMAEPFPLTSYGWHSVEAIHLMTEAERRVYADRAMHLGDPDYWPVPVEGLLEASYLRARMADFDPQQATPSNLILAGNPNLIESVETTHYSIVDSMGRAVSVTTTLNGGYGAGVVVGGAGFLLNNEMDDFSVKPGVPNAYGLLGAEANAIEPGKRMLSSMTPTIVTRGDSLLMVVGTPGGSTIITSVFQNILQVVDHGMPMQTSVEAPRFHHQWQPDRIDYEEGAFSPEVADKLKKMGHELFLRGPMGRVDAILVRSGGSLETGADPRGDDRAGGF